MNVVKNLFRGPDRGGNDSISTSAQWAIAASLGSNQQQSNEIPITESGVSLSTLVTLSSALTKLGSTYQNMDTHTLVKQLIKPVTSARKCRLLDLVDTSRVGKPHFCISYPWRMPFQAMEKQVENEVTKIASTEVSSPSLPDAIFVWIDIIALNQHTQFNAQADISLVKSLVKSCPQGLALVVDSYLIALTRSWCLFEAWSFVYHDGISKLRVCMPSELSVDFLTRYEDQVQSIDLNKTETTKPEDKTKILSEIRGSSGFKLMQRSLQEALVVSVRAGLRWGSREDEDMRRLGLYAGLLLKGAEYHRLQRLLYEIPSIQDNEEMLREVEGVFMLYVDGPDDELDEEQFCKVLLRSGFTSDEVHKIYREVNTDDGPGVGMDEFKTWWLKSKRQEETRRRPPLSLTADSLVKNLESLLSTLERLGLLDLCKSIKNCMSSEEFKSKVKGDRELPSAILQGDSRAVADQVAWTLHNRDYRKTVLTLMDVLRWNLDAIDMPPSKLPRPDREENLTAESLLSALSIYLEQFALLLKYEGKGKQEQHAAYFLRFAQELKVESTVRQLVEAQEAQGLSSAKLNFERISIVREMISLKYGPKQPVNHSLIIEAEKSLSMWMAGNRRDAKQSQGMVRDLANDYLSSYSPSKASEVAVVTIPGKGVVKGLERKKRLSVSLPDHEIPSVLTKLGPEAAAYEAARRAAEESDDAGGDNAASSGHGHAGKVKRGTRSRRSSVESLDLESMREVASMQNIAQGGAFGGIQNRLQRLNPSPSPSPSPSPLEPYHVQQSTSDNDNYFGEATGLVSGRSASAMSFSSPSAMNQGNRSPSFLSPPSPFGSPPNRSPSLNFPKSGGKARRASMLPDLSNLGPILEGGKGGGGDESLASVPGLAASLLASAGFGNGASNSSSPSSVVANKSASRFMPAEMTGPLSVSSPLSPLQLRARDRGNSKDFVEGERSSQQSNSATLLPRLPNNNSHQSKTAAEDKGLSTSPSRLPNILARRSII